MNTWIEISKANLTHNIKEFRKLIGPDAILAPAIKGNAYGHRLEICAEVMLEAGANWFSVFSLEDLRRLRKINAQIPVLLFGYVKLDELKEAVSLNPRFFVWNLETLEKLGEISKGLKTDILVHLKLETGNNRYGINKCDIDAYLDLFKQYKNLKLEGAVSHFANVEDTTNHSYAEKQLKSFHDFTNYIESKNVKIPIKHLSNSAATMLWKKAHLNLVRTGIANYGLWPSQEVYKLIDLKPVMTWKTIVSQIKDVNEGEFVGYGCTYKTTRKSKIAVLPIGYYDGFDRRISNKGYVLINGKRARVLGRICMNVIMVDATDIENIKLEDEVVLIGKQGKDEITIEQMADWDSTLFNYEIPTRINEKIPRILL